jgi:hypothetical protein
MRRKFAAQAEELRCSGKPQGCFIPSRERPIEPPNFGPFRGIKKGPPKQWGARRLFLHPRRSAALELAQSRSKIAAIPCPPPMHIVTSA